jgi:hypothetical protein
LQVLKVEVDKSSGAIRFTRIFSTLTFYKHDISGYYSTIYNGNRGRPWYGLLVKTVSQQSFSLTEQNMQSISKLKEFFEQEGLTYLGEKRSIIFS